MKADRHKPIDALDGRHFGFRADLEKFVIVEVGAEGSGNGRLGGLVEFKTNHVAGIAEHAMSDFRVASQGTTLGFEVYRSTRGKFDGACDSNSRIGEVYALDLDELHLTRSVLPSN